MLEDPDVVNDALDLHSVVYREDSGESSGVVFREKSCLIGVNKILETVEDQSPDVLSEKQTINVESSQASSSNFISAFKNRRKLKLDHLLFTPEIDVVSICIRKESYFNTGIVRSIPVTIKWAWST